MKKHLIVSCALMVLSFMGEGALHATGDKSTELKMKMSEINTLQHDLSGKIALAREKRDQMAQKTQELKAEIRDQKEQFDIKTYQKALLNARIDYNLKLIQLLIGYMTRLDDKIAYFNTGSETLNYYYQQAQDDLLMIKTLNDLEIDKLIAKINEILDEYIPQTSKPLFDVSDVPLKETKQIWQEIVAEKTSR